MLVARLGMWGHFITMEGMSRYGEQHALHLIRAAIAEYCSLLSLPKERHVLWPASDLPHVCVVADILFNGPAKPAQQSFQSRIVLGTLTVS